MSDHLLNWFGVGLGIVPMNIKLIVLNRQGVETWEEEEDGGMKRKGMRTLSYVYAQQPLPHPRCP
jgi:hypothetical protein